MSVIIRAALAIQPGCRLHYDPPLRGYDYKSQEFFDKYRNKYATCVGYSEDLVGPLDHMGRLPGRHVSQEGIQVRFDGEEKVHESINIQHFIVRDVDSNHAHLGELVSGPRRLGDLLHPMLFYSGDMVRFKKKPQPGLADVPRLVVSHFLDKPFCMDGVPRYQVTENDDERERRVALAEEKYKDKEDGWFMLMQIKRQVNYWNIAGEDLELVSRGNVWALYEDPAKLSFESDEAELAFWAQNGICHYVPSETKERVLEIDKRTLQNKFGLSLENAWRLFVEGHADVIQLTLGNPGDGPRYDAKYLHDCFAQHRERVRALNERHWAHQLKESAA